MIIIADSGSTKTEWGVVEHGKLTGRYNTGGMNPFLQTPAEMSAVITRELLPQMEGTKFDEIHFFGSGILPEKLALVAEVLGSHFEVTGTIEVASDMVGAAMAVCGHTPGIACIMGTGSNSCFWDSRKIARSVPAGGFILGDEGSGSVLGRMLVSDILKNQFPEELSERFYARYNLTPGEIIERVYRQPFPNRFLASLSPFLAENIAHQSVYRLVREAFRAFFTRNVMAYDYRVHAANFVGSIAFHYREVLEAAAAEVGVGVGMVVKSPMDGLVEYFTTE